MMDVTVKTLDGQNRSFSVPENITVRQFKEKISNSISIPAETQRLIFQGRVLHDEKPLKDYDVHGKVVHVVLRPPPGSGRPAGNDNAQPSSTPPGRDPNSVVVGSFSLPADMIDTNMVQNIAQDAVRSMGDMGRNARVSTRTSTDGSAVDVHIHLGPVQTGAAVSEAQMRLNTARQMMRLATEALNQLENPEGTERQTDSASASGSSSEPVTGEESVPVQETVRDTVTSTTENQSQSSPMETSDTDDSAAESSSTSANQSSERVSNEQQQNGSQQPRGPVRPNISALGDVLVEVNELNRRLQPHIERFTSIVQEDGEMNQNQQRENQRVCNMVSEAMHAVSHSYHAISDLMVDLSQNRPRQLYVTLAIAHPHTAVIQQSVPVQAQIQVGGSPRLIRRQFATPRATQPSTNTSNTSPVSVPSSIPSGATTTTTGTSTGPQPSTAETGTQSSESGTQPATSTFGAQHNAGLSDGEMHRLSQQMSAGLQNVLGQGLQQGDGTPDNPYVFVEMGPDSMTVNSISAEVVTTDENGVPTSRSSPTPAGPQAAPTPAPQPTGQDSASTGATQQPQGDQGQGMLPPDFIQNLVQQIVGQTGAGQSQPQRMQINISQGSPPRMGMPRPGMPMGIRLGPHMMRPGAPRNESGTQTFGGNGVPANSGTQTSATPTSASGTQTTTNAAPSSTSGTQTAGAPRAAAFVVPGMPGLAQNISPADQYLPCSSRHFLTQHARGILNQAGPQNNDTALADMLNNLMSGLLGGTPPSTAATTTTTTGSAPSTASSTISGQSAGQPGGQPRPAGIRIGGPGATFQLGGMPGLPAGLGGIFRGQMPFMQGMRFSVGSPRQQPPGSRPAGPTAPPATSATSSTGTSTPASATGTPGSAGGAEPNFIQMLRTMLQSADQQGNQSSNASTAQPRGNQAGESANREQAISDETFTQLVGGITGYMSQAALGQAPRQTIAEFLTGLGQNYNIPQGEGFISDVMSCVLANLQITDLISVFYGSPAPLNQIRRPLREFLSRRVLHGKPPFPENIRTSVQELVHELSEEIQETVDSTQPRPHIDFQATLNHFFNQQFYNIVSLVMNAREGDVHFGQDIYACVRRMLSEMFILCSRCLGGMQNVERMVTQRLNTLAAGVNPAIQDWMSSMTGRQLSQFIPTITVSEGEISHYLIYKEVGRPSSAATAPPSSQATTPAPKPSTSTAPSSTTGTAATKREPSPLRAPSPKRVSVPVEESAKRGAQPMETCSPVSTTSPGASEIETDSHKPSPTREVKGAASADSTSKPTVEAESQPSPSGAQSVNTEWQSVLPKEWVPVIERDIEKQKNQTKQQPHSDVYLQGLPPKRRRLMTQDRPGDLSNTSDVLPESIHRAVAAAAVEPISSIENLSSELSHDTELHGAFESNLSNTLSQRLQNDKDFNKDRFPNSEEYFHKGSKKNQ